MTLIPLRQTLNSNVQHFSSFHSPSLSQFAVTERIVRELLADADAAQRGDADLLSLSSEVEASYGAVYKQKQRINPQLSHSRSEAWLQSQESTVDSLFDY